jgi:hypothetical protein
MRFIILFLVVFINCELYEEEIIEVGRMDNYTFEHNIAINKVNDAMLYLHDNIEYKTDVGDYWQLPEETYNLQSGDCEDQAILFMYFMKTSLNIDTSFIYVENSEYGHALVYPVKFEDEDYYYDPVSNNFIKDVGDNWAGGGWYIKFIISYEETMWMTYNYHNNVGKYR